MKNKIYLVGIITTIILCSGCQFKIMHWPGAGILLVVGIVLLSLVFIPLALMSSYKNETSKNMKTLYIVAGICFSIDFIGAMFKIMHWPGAGKLLMIGLPLPFLVLLPMYLYYNRKDEDINYRNFMPVIFFFAYFAAISALLVLGVSKNIVDDFADSAKAYELKTNILHEQGLDLYKNRMTDSTYSIENKKVLQDIENQAILVESKIENLKQVLVIENSRNPSDAIQKGEIDISKIQMKDANPDNGFYYEEELKKEILKLKKMMLANSRLNAESRAVLDQMFYEENQEQWQHDVFKNKILISAIDALNRLKYQVNLAEYVVLQ